MTPTLIPLASADVPAAAQIWCDGWHEAHAHLVPADLTRLRTYGNFSDRLYAHLDRTMAAYAEGEVLGFAITRENELYQMYVGANARGSGTASLLIGDAERRIAMAGHNAAWLDCAIGNDRARRFYEKSGWLYAGVTPSQLDTSEGPFTLNLWRFEKPLSRDQP